MRRSNKPKPTMVLWSSARSFKSCVVYKTSHGRKFLEQVYCCLSSDCFKRTVKIVTTVIFFAVGNLLGTIREFRRSTRRRKEREQWRTRMQRKGGGDLKLFSILNWLTFRHISEFIYFFYFTNAWNWQELISKQCNRTVFDIFQ